MWRAFPQTVTYANASLSCARVGGHLATVRTEEDRRCFQAALQAMYTTVRNGGEWENIWVGLDDRKEEGVYVWSYDGHQEPENSRNWLQHQPGSADDPHGRDVQDCGYARGKLFDEWTGRLGDDECGKKMRYICQRDRGEDLA